MHQPPTESIVPTILYEWMDHTFEPIHDKQEKTVRDANRQGQYSGADTMRWRCVMDSSFLTAYQATRFYYYRHIDVTRWSSCGCQWVYV